MLPWDSQQHLRQPSAMEQRTVSPTWLQGALPGAPNLLGRAHRAEVLFHGIPRLQGWSRAGFAAGGRSLAELMAGCWQRDERCFLSFWHKVWSGLVSPDELTALVQSECQQRRGEEQQSCWESQGYFWDCGRLPSWFLCFKTWMWPWSWSERASPSPTSSSWDGIWATELRNHPRASGVIPSQENKPVALCRVREHLGTALRPGPCNGNTELCTALSKALTALCPEAQSPLPTFSRAQPSQNVIQSRPAFCSPLQGAQN